MKKSIKISALISTACMLAASAAFASMQLPTTADILSDIQKVKTERNLDARMLLASHMLDDLYIVWNHKAMNTIDDRVIDELISLLNEDEDGVRMAAAAGIGDFGRRARRAGPALEHALRRSEEENRKSGLLFVSGVDSAAVIVPALKRIQGIPDSEIFDDPPKQDGRP